MISHTKAWGRAVCRPVWYLVQRCWAEIDPNTKGWVWARPSTNAPVPHYLLYLFIYYFSCTSYNELLRLVLNMRTLSSGELKSLVSSQPPAWRRVSPCTANCWFYLFRLSREGQEAILQEGFLSHVLTQVWWLQPPSVGKLPLSHGHRLAPGMLCVWGLYTHLSFGLRQSQGSSFLRGRTATGKKVHLLEGGSHQLEGRDYCGPGKRGCRHLLISFASGWYSRLHWPGSWQEVQGCKFYFADILLLTSAFLFFPFTLSPRTASAVSLPAPSLNWTDVRIVSSITISAGEHFATGAGSPSPAAASVPWATSSIPSTSSVPSAWHSCQRASSGSRMTRPIVSPASRNSSHCNLSWTHSLRRSPTKFKPGGKGVYFVVTALQLSGHIGKVKVMNF